MSENWSEKECCIAFYFIAREAPFALEVASELIKKKCDTTRTLAACGSKVKKLRESIPKKYGREDPYSKAGYDLDIVDYWLSQQMDKGKLEDLLGIKDNKIVDKEVLEIVKGHLSPVWSLHSCLKVALI